MRSSIRKVLDAIFIGKTAPTYIESTGLRGAVSIVGGLLGAVVAFVFGWSEWSTIALVFVVTFLFVHVAGYIVNHDAIES
jgi:VIT1/CCC1 family predicted Fe2+/Mn2+ transporter